MSIEVRTQVELDAALKRSGDGELIVLVGDGTFEFRGSSSPTVVARESSSPRVVARESSSPRVVARESSSPTVVARGSSSPRVVAWGSSSPTVVARESSSPRVEAWESSSPRGSVGRYAAVVASKHDQAKLRIPGAVILETPKIETAEDWCDYYGVKVSRGIAVLYKAVTNDWKSGRGMSYEPGTKPEAPDWDPVPECGGGLHFSPSPSGALRYHPEAKRFVACPVRLSEIVVHPAAMYPDKVKAPRVARPTYEVDIDGERIA